MARANSEFFRYLLTLSLKKPSTYTHRLYLSVCPVVVDDRRERQNLALDCASSRTLRAMTSHLRAYCNSGLKHFAVCVIAHSSIDDGGFPTVRLEMIENLNCKHPRAS